MATSASSSAPTPDARSLLVLTDVHYPGWKATVDGEPAQIERVDYLLRGVRVPAGSHRVEFSYEPLELADRLDRLPARPDRRVARRPRWSGCAARRAA